MASIRIGSIKFGPLTPEEAREIFQEWLNEEDICDGCGQWFARKDLRRYGGEGVYCSRECWEDYAYLEEW